MYTGVGLEGVHIWLLNDTRHPWHKVPYCMYHVPVVMMYGGIILNVSCGNDVWRHHIKCIMW